MSKVQTFDMHKFLPYLLNQASENSGVAFENIIKHATACLELSGELCFI